MKDEDGIKHKIEPVEAFHKFERAVKHILTVPKEKVVIPHKKNGHKSKSRSR